MSNINTESVQENLSKGKAPMQTEQMKELSVDGAEAEPGQQSMGRLELKERSSFSSNDNVTSENANATEVNSTGNSIASANAGGGAGWRTKFLQLFCCCFCCHMYSEAADDGTFCGLLQQLFGTAPDQPAGSIVPDTMEIQSEISSSTWMQAFP